MVGVPLMSIVSAAKSLRMLPLFLLFGLHAFSAGAADLGGCVPGGVTSGPYDYRAAPGDVLGRVEHFHFSSQVEALVKGDSSAYIGADLDFVLRYFPNHHRALSAMARLAKRDKTSRPKGAGVSVDCYFELASRIAPDDGMVDLLYGMWLLDAGNKVAAQERLARAQKTVPPDNANYQYNLGLGWFALGRYDDALIAAHAAYGRGYPLPGLRQKLEKAGKWKPVPPVESVLPESKEGGGADEAGKPQAPSGEGAP